MENENERATANVGVLAGTCVACVSVMCTVCGCDISDIALEFMQIDHYHLARMLMTNTMCCEHEGTG